MHARDVSIRVQSAKQKGRRLQQYVVDKLHEYFPQLKKGDARSTSMGAGGQDVQLSPAARECFNFAVECKNVEKLNIWNAIDQAVANIDDDYNDIPLVVFSRNNCKTYAVIEFDEFMKLLTKDKDWGY